MFMKCEFPSQALGYPASVDILLPDGLTGEKYPVLYLLHGGDGTPWIRHTAIERYAQKARIAVVMPFSRNTCWRKAEITYPGMAWEKPKVEDFETFMMSELNDIVTGYFPVSSNTEDTYIAGLSLGGYGAAYYGVAYPKHFAEVGIFSGYLFNQKMFQVDRITLSHDELAANLIPDLVEPVKAAGSRQERLPKFFMMNGTEDVCEFSLLYAELLQENGAEVITDFDTYELGHEWDMWEICIREFLKDITIERQKRKR